MAFEDYLYAVTSSRYKFSEKIVFADGTEYYKDRKKPDTTSQTDDIFYEVKEWDTVNSIAQAVYGDFRLWWIICDWNNMRNPFLLVPRTILRLPSLEHAEIKLLG